MTNISDKCKLVDPKNDIDKLLYKLCANDFRKAFVEIGDDKILMPITYVDIADDIENFEVRDTDVWIVSFPKTGTTWTQEMVWMITHDVDFEGAKKNLLERTTFLEFQGMFDFKEIKNHNSDFKELPDNAIKTVKTAKNDMRVPRIIKTHLPWVLLPKALREGTTKAKMVYVARNPKDTCISFYHHHRLVDSYNGSLEDFCKLFLADRVYYAPYWSMLEFWDRRESPNILFLKYEDMKKDLTTVIKKTSDYLINKQLTDNQLSDLVEHLSFENMKKNPYVNYDNILHKKYFQFKKCVDSNVRFMRSGIVGSYKIEMTPENVEKFDEWSKMHTEGKNITF